MTSDYVAGSLVEGRQDAPSSRLASSKAIAKAPFLKGPICLQWLARAVRLRKPALAAGLALWFMRGVTRNAGAFKITRALRRRFHLSGPQMLRGLRALEGAKLVRFVKSGRGRCSVVEIIDLTPYRGRTAGNEGNQQPSSELARSPNRAIIEGQLTHDCNHRQRWGIES